MQQFVSPLKNFPGILVKPKSPKILHDIGGTHTITVIYGASYICRVSWGAQELFSQCGTFQAKWTLFSAPVGTFNA